VVVVLVGGALVVVVPTGGALVVVVPTGGALVVVVLNGGAVVVVVVVDELQAVEITMIRIVRHARKKKTFLFLI
jgi:hypothetical protein